MRRQKNGQSAVCAESTNGHIATLSAWCEHCTCTFLPRLYSSIILSHPSMLFHNLHFRLPPYTPKLHGTVQTRVGDSVPPRDKQGGHSALHIAHFTVVSPGFPDASGPQRHLS